MLVRDKAAAGAVALITGNAGGIGAAVATAPVGERTAEGLRAARTTPGASR